ncbi:MAG: YihY/virulence factor BrkB family protein [Bryobacteraceae bacterium]|jgi:membrane protein
MRPDFRTVWFLLRRSVVASFDDDQFGIAKGAAYSALLSFFPVLTSAAAILVQTRAQFVSRAIEGALSDIVPPGTEDLVVQQFRVTGERPLTLLVVAGAVSLWAASSVIKSLIDGFQAAYRAPRDRGFLRQSYVAIALALLCAVPLVGAAVLVLFGTQIERGALASIKTHGLWDPPDWLWHWLTRLARYLVAFVTASAMAACLFYFGPYRPQRWRFVWRGAVLATVLWLASTAGFGWYVRHMASYNVMYGSIGAGIALLVWMYLMSVAALIGCEYNAAYERSVSA